MPKSGLPRSVSRRALLAGAGGLTASALASPYVSAQTRERLVVRDAGGVHQQAVVEAFNRPFSQMTGVEVVPAAAGPDPLAQVRAMVGARNYIWDVVLMRRSGAELLARDGMFEELAWTNADMQDIMPQARSRVFMGIDVFASVWGYRTNSVRGQPNTWADFWDVRQFPGRRALPRNAVDVIEQALLSDGVAAANLYPLDVPRALRRLDAIKPHISVWWTGGAQAAQLIQTGEVDMVATWNARLQAPIDEGAPVRIVWNQGLGGIEGWTIPRGNPKRELCQRYIEFCARPDRQAAFSQVISYGPTNPKAYAYITPQRAAMLPTSPANVAGIVYSNEEFWSLNQERIQEQFLAWLRS